MDEKKPDVIEVGDTSGAYIPVTSPGPQHDGGSHVPGAKHPHGHNVLDTSGAYIPVTSTPPPTLTKPYKGGTTIQMTVTWTQPKDSDKQASTITVTAFRIHEKGNKDKYQTNDSGAPVDVPIDWGTTYPLVVPASDPDGTAVSIHLLTPTVANVQVALQFMIANKDKTCYDVGGRVIDITP
jgi:hypothetical protein